MTDENYYGEDADKNYMSYSQFKNYKECEAMALAIDERRYIKPTTDALLQGSYIDAYFSGEMDAFNEKHPEIYKKDGSLKADFAVVQKVIEAIKANEPFHDMFFTGDSQKILTGVIGGVPYRGKLDFLFDNKIVDMKCMASKSLEGTWIEVDGKNQKVPFWFAFGYHYQAAIYRELVRQTYGTTLPYYLAVATKEDTPSMKAMLFDSETLDDALKEVEALSPRYWAIKNHEIEPTECKKCDFYKQTHKFDPLRDIEVIGYQQMIKKEELL